MLLPKKLIEQYCYHVIIVQCACVGYESICISIGKLESKVTKSIDRPQAICNPLDKYNEALLVVDICTND